jgi:GDP-4-dehydro-6-deoxy-D-mannose reductase
VRQSTATGLSATVMRPFNHIGPGQAEAFVAPSFAGQIARIEAGLQEPVLSVGSLDDERDFLDVQDVVRAYADALDVRAALEPGEVFNVASGKAVRIGEVLDILLSQASVPIEVRVDPSRLRSAVTPRVVGDATRLREKAALGPRDPSGRHAVAHPAGTPGGHRRSTSVPLSLGKPTIRELARATAASPDSPQRSI